MNKIRFCLLSLLLCTLTAFGKNHPQIQAAYDLIERIIPGYGNQFKLELIKPVKGEDAYEIDSKNGKIVLRGNNAISLATAFNQYLKYTCNAHVSWFGNQLNLPQQLPMPQKSVRNTINGKYRVYMNYCTVSYTAAWWDWKRWEKELDYMAMNSINMPLSVVGLEAVWYNTLLKYKFTDEEARKFLAGPGHFAWQWMQNLQSYGGPLPKSWIDKHIVLGKQIMDRQLELGMQPIQQGFSGYVPRELKEKYPDAKIKLQPKWCGCFTGSAQLDPTDPLFSKFGRDFLEEEKKLFGAHGVYAADPFHESAPPVDTPEYLSAVGRSIYRLFQDFDAGSQWAMQAWSLREPIVKAVPKNRLIILDLNGARSQKENAVWGYPIVAGNLHNFGGRVNLHGDLRLLASNQYERALAKNPNICGSGLFMESIVQNPVYYDLAFEMPLHHDSIPIEKWLAQYAHRRYGYPSENAVQAMLCLLEGPYRPGTNGTERSSIIAARPAVDCKKSGPNAGLGIPYNPLLLLKAEGLLLQDAEKMKASSPYRFDVVDVQRQIMSNLGQAIHKQAAEAFKQKDKAAFRLHSRRFLEMLTDADELLRTREEFNMDKWIEDARSWGDNDAEKNLLEKDATSLITIWGADEGNDPKIFDYSWREWTGLIDGFYYQRWIKFYSMLEEHLNNGTEYNESGLPQVYGREAFRANTFYNELANFELNYAATPYKVRYPITQGCELEVASRLYKKYLKLAKEYYAEDMKEDTIKEGNIFENLGESSEQAKIVTPNPIQQKWADAEIGVLIHFDMPVFRPEYNWRNWGSHPDASVFNPTQLDTDQWLKAASQIGAKYAVLVAKHCSGFSLWPTEAHAYSIKHSPWKNGKGDIVKDFIASCAKYGIRPGIYASTSANGFLRVDNPGLVQKGSPVSQKEYNDIVVKQLTELWSNYGKLFEIWFDGGVLAIDKGGADVLSLVKRLQPEAIAFQGPLGHPNLIRWVGNEEGVAPYPCWATADSTTNADGTVVVKGLHGNPMAPYWCPGESDFTLRKNNSFQGGWFWHAGEDHKLFSTDELVKKYETSVGRNTNMLLGIVIDNRGLVPDADMKRLEEFGNAIRKKYTTPVAQTSGSGNEYTLSFDAPESIDRVVIQEDIAQGERVLQYTVQGKTGNDWVNLCSGTCIGHKRIETFRPVSVSQLRLVIATSKAKPQIKKFAAFEVQ